MNALRMCVPLGIGILAFAGCVSEPVTTQPKPEPLPARPVFHVSTQGSDAWSGSEPEPNAERTDGPFATLERARDAIRALKAKGPITEDITVWVHGGTYFLDKTLELTEQDSGAEKARFAYRARSGEEVRLVGGKALSGFKPVTDSAVLDRLDERARGKVLQVDLRANGITDYGKASGGGLELFFQDKPMQIARWPNSGFTQIAGILGIKPHKIHGRPGDKVGKFIYSGDRPKRWVGEKDVWLHGYWFWDWSDQRQKVESIDVDKRVIALVPPYHGYGYRKGQWYYAFNALSELDLPGEWYLDRETGVLYFWPPAPIDRGRAVVSVIGTLISMKNVSDVTMRGFVMEAARSTAVVMGGGTRNEVVGCVIRNTGSGGVSISGGSRNGVVGCDIYEVGKTGIRLSGGDRKTLTPAGHYAENNHIHHYGRWNRMYCPAVSLGGVGNRASHNLMHNAPHQAISFGGNDHVMEFNEIHSVCYESNDAGAIYSGRDWTMRGTVIRHNFMHHVSGFRARGCVGVYLDDMFCGTEISGNVFYKVTRAAFIGGGRDVVVDNNIFVDCNPAMHVDNRAMNWAKYHVATTMKQRLDAMPYKQPPWSERYPKLLTTWEDEPAVPKGNIVTNNICYGGRWDEIVPVARQTGRFENNIINEDPCFVQAEEMNFELRDDSPMYGRGFKRIPFEKIGLYEDERRASWPVAHKVRLVIIPPPTPVQKEEPKKADVPKVYNVPRRKAEITIDGNVTAAEWNGADKKKAMLLTQGIHGDEIGPKSYAWLAYDARTLYVAVANDVDSGKSLRKGNSWGQDDAVEVALRNKAAGATAPIFVLRGFPSGHFLSSDEAGAPAKAVKKAGDAVKYAAKIAGKDKWSAEYAIPFAALGIDPNKHSELEFNITVRKSAGPIWLMWQGTGGYSWRVDQAGRITLVK